MLACGYGVGEGRGERGEGRREEGGGGIDRVIEAGKDMRMPSTRNKIKAAQ